MSEKKLLYSVKEVFTSYLKQGEFYNIPEYQRGYKWNSKHVQTLLDDLLKFEDSCGDSSYFYCLQNITMVSNGQSYNVVDGQQRLTTLYILMSYLKKIGKLDFDFSTECLCYSVRTETGQMLREQIATGFVWDKPINPDEAPHKDQWYILDVAKGIQDWFNGTDNTIPHTFVSTITNRLQLIVNEMKEGNEATIFAGLNSGKVDLDGADLVRAELITRAAREKYGNLDPNKVGEFRAYIGLVLDEMVRWWNDNDHQTFFNQMLPDKEETTEFHNSYKINTLYRLYFYAYKKEGDKFGFRFFENGRDFNAKKGDDHWEFYASLIRMHNTLKDWYNTPEMFHWIGYLFFNFKGNKEVSFAQLWKSWENKQEDREAFLTGIKKQIVSLVKKRYTSEDTSESSLDPLLKNVGDLSHDWYHDDFLDKILILVEILWLEENKYTHHLRPQNLRLYNEQKEHIRSCSPNPKEGKENTSKTEWRAFVQKTYTEDEPMRNDLLKLIEGFEDTLTEDNVKSINIKMNEYAQNSLGNMVLLDGQVNMSYGNALYREKVQRIIWENTKNTHYIRPYTFDVFLKKIESEDKEWRWSKQDIEASVKRTSELLAEFLNAYK
ncbi:MAG: DUF262 domain-containing protein [Paludibacteraceae bacterium]